MVVHGECVSCENSNRISDRKPPEFQCQFRTDVSAFAWTGLTNGNGTTLDSTKVGDSVSITLNVPAAGIYDVKYAVKEYVTRGISQLAINGINLGPAKDQYASSEVWAEFDMGTVALAAGNQVFRFTVAGKNTASSNYSLAWDYIKLTPQ